jgi:hypothetical protein
MLVSDLRLERERCEGLGGHFASFFLCMFHNSVKSIRGKVASFLQMLNKLDSVKGPW